MKNIFLLSTDKPSRIRIGNNGNFVIGLTQSTTASKNDSYTNQHIYITSDEEIKEGDYSIAYSVTSDKKPYISCASEYKERKKEKGKIILTTDQDLINDGVQAIDDEFIEWFVENPSCEEIEVRKGFADGTSYGYNFLDYKIIIPKEEPKQEISINEVGIFSTQQFTLKQETLEEVAKKYAELSYYGDEVDAFVRGAKWQQERMYSEEDMFNFLDFINNRYYGSFSIDKEDLQEWFEQFKKK